LKRPQDEPRERRIPLDDRGLRDGREIAGQHGRAPDARRSDA